MHSLTLANNPQPGSISSSLLKSGHNVNVEINKKKKSAMTTFLLAIVENNLQCLPPSPSHLLLLDVWGFTFSLL